jgi:hypothetical protein
MTHKLLDQLMAENVTDDEIADLYKDLQHIFDTLFDELINEAVSKRGCVYVEVCQLLAN